MKSFDELIQNGYRGHPPESKVLGIGGSPRKGGNSDVLLTHILKGAGKAGVNTEKIQLRNYQYQGCIGCERCRKDKICTGLMDGMSLLYLKIVASQALVLVSPTHNYNVTAWMKAFIDRLYCFYDFDNHRPGKWSSRLADQNRKALIVAVCEQKTKKDMGLTIDAMRLPLEALGYDVIGELPAFGVFSKAKVKENREVLKKAEGLGLDLAGSIL